MYDASDDEYCYPGTTVLKNLPNLKTQVELDKFEAIATTTRAGEPLPKGRLNYAHYRAIHRHLYQDVYSWVGNPRTVRISKGGNPFCYPEYIDAQMEQLFQQLSDENEFRDLDPETFAKKAAHFLSELNAIHPFREGNGRTQTSFLFLLADQARHPLDPDRLNPAAMLEAMVNSFNADERPLADLILQMMRVR